MIRFNYILAILNDTLDVKCCVQRILIELGVIYLPSKGKLTPHQGLAENGVFVGAPCRPPAPV